MIPRPNGTFFDHEKWFLTYLIYIQEYTKIIRIFTHWFFTGEIGLRGALISDFRTQKYFFFTNWFAEERSPGYLKIPIVSKIRNGGAPVLVAKLIKKWDVLFFLTFPPWLRLEKLCGTDGSVSRVKMEDTAASFHLNSSLLPGEYISINLSLFYFSSSLLYDIFTFFAFMTPSLLQEIFKMKYLLSLTSIWNPTYFSADARVIQEINEMYWLSLSH